MRYGGRAGQTYGVAAPRRYACAAAVDNGVGLSLNGGASRPSHHGGSRSAPAPPREVFLPGPSERARCAGAGGGDQAPRRGEAAVGPAVGLGLERGLPAPLPVPLPVPVRARSPLRPARSSWARLLPPPGGLVLRGGEAA